MKSDIKFIPYRAEFHSAFKELNIWWVKKYFKVEPIDLEYLDNPEEKIINKGGYIFFALHEEQAVGVCALIKMDEEGNVFELSKMGVQPAYHGLKIGLKLIQYVIAEAKLAGIHKLYLESNRVLVPAISLYRKTGFVELPEFSSRYERANIAMELILKD